MEAHVNQLVFSVADFCTLHAISRAKFYQLLDAGLAPATFFVGRRRLITLEAARDWRLKMESRSDDPERARETGNRRSWQTGGAS